MTCSIGFFRKSTACSRCRWTFILAANDDDDDDVVDVPGGGPSASVAAGAGMEGELGALCSNREPRTQTLSADDETSGERRRGAGARAAWTENGRRAREGAWRAGARSRSFERKGKRSELEEDDDNGEDDQGCIATEMSGMEEEGWRKSTQMRRKTRRRS